MKRWIGVCVFVLCLSPCAAWCAEVAPSHRQAAVELLQLAGASRAIEAGANAMIEAQVHSNPAIEPYRDVLLQWIQKYITWDSMEPQLVDLYTEAFTEAELREVITFYRTPTGQKTIQKLPELMQKGAVLGVELAKQHQGELEKMIRARKEELDKAKKKDGE